MLLAIPQQNDAKKIKPNVIKSNLASLSLWMGRAQDPVSFHSPMLMMMSNCYRVCPRHSLQMNGSDDDSTTVTFSQTVSQSRPGSPSRIKRFCTVHTALMTFEVDRW